MTACRLALPQGTRDHSQMAADRFADRLTEQTYVDDEPVGVFEADPSEQVALWISERLFHRLVLIARAYELHVLPMLGGTERITLGRAQCESLLDELEFVIAQLNDDLALATARSIAQYVRSRIYGSLGDFQVSFEGS
jgi:hypothetical protein